MAGRAKRRNMNDRSPIRAARRRHRHQSGSPSAGQWAQAASKQQRQPPARPLSGRPDHSRSRGRLWRQAPVVVGAAASDRFFHSFFAPIDWRSSSDLDQRRRRRSMAAQRQSFGQLAGLGSSPIVASDGLLEPHNSGACRRKMTARLPASSETSRRTMRAAIPA